MQRTVRLNSVAYDTATLRPGQQELLFFHEREGPSVDDTARNEHQLVEWLSSDNLTWPLLLHTLALPSDTAAARRVVQPFLPNSGGKPGDIDLLLSTPALPQRAVALECKRVRVRAGSGDQRVNRLEDLADAPEQVNGLCSLGFSQTYLGVIAVVRDPSDREYNYVSRGLREATFSRVVHLAEGLGLQDSVGILYVEIAQPLPDSIRTSGVVCAGILRAAARRDQTQDLTALVERYFALTRDV
jgi:hypothetical protein